MFIDTHAHIYLDVFDDDFEGVLERARDAGVEMIVMPAIDVPSIERAIELSERHDGLFAMAALHPSEVKSAADAEFARVVELCSDPHVVAVGETGLDYYWDRSFDAKQQDFLRKHIRLAVEADLPVVFHNREATDDLLRIVGEEREACADPSRLRGIFHCFTGTASEAARMWSLGFFVGMGGILTFKNSDLAKVARRIPLEHIVLETDSPYLAPAPYRGKRNEPAHIPLIAQNLALAKDISVDTVADATTQSARAIFGLHKSGKI